jgi:lambda family phage portal protein
MSVFGRLRAALHAMTTPMDKGPKAMGPDQYYGPDFQHTGGSRIINGEKFSGAMGGYNTIRTYDDIAILARARQAYWDNPHAKALVRRRADNEVGPGLALQVAPIWELIEPKADQTDDDVLAARHAFKREAEVRFHLWANSHEADSLGQNSFYWLQRFAKKNKKVDGEIFVILRYSDDPSRMSPLSLQFLLPEQIVQPSSSDMEAAKARGGSVQRGIEFNANGEEIAIFVQKVDQWGIPMGQILRFPFYGDSGRRFVIHSSDIEHVGRVRGTSSLAPYVHEFQKTEDWMVAELEAANINAMFALEHYAEKDAPKGPSIAAGVTKSNAKQTGVTDDLGTGRGFSSFPGLVAESKPGNRLVSFDTKRPNANGHEFVRGVHKQVDAAEGIGIAMVEMEHNASYSAARGAMVQAWTGVEIGRDEDASQFYDIVYEAWFREEIAKKTFKAKGFGKSPALDAAWLNHSWLGQSMPTMDPEKEARAVDIRIAQGTLTREKAAMQHNGSDFTENVARLEIENAALAKANLPMAVLLSKQIPLDFIETGEIPEEVEPPEPIEPPESEPENPPKPAQNDPNEEQS